MNVAYTLIADGAYDERFTELNAQLLSEAVREVASFPVVDGLEWNPETWGTTDEAQASLARALAFSGPPADAPVG